MIQAPHQFKKKRPSRGIRLKPIAGKDFWDGVLTRTQLAEKTKKLENEIKGLKKKKMEQENNSDMCVICQENCLEASENSTPCGHIFHTGCLLGWLKDNNTCPCCREDLYNKPDVPSQNEIENLVENILTMHLDIDPTTTTEMPFMTSTIMFQIGDEIARLAVEQSLDEDLDWIVPELTDDSEEDEEERGPIVEVSSSDMSVDTPPLNSIDIPPLNLDLLTPPEDPYIIPDDLEITSTGLYSLSGRTSGFMRAWNAINDEV